MKKKKINFEEQQLFFINHHKEDTCVSQFAILVSILFLITVPLMFLHYFNVINVPWIDMERLVSFLILSVILIGGAYLLLSLIGLVIINHALNEFIEERQYGDPVAKNPKGKPDILKISAQCVGLGIGAPKFIGLWYFIKNAFILSFPFGLLMLGYNNFIVFVMFVLIVTTRFKVLDFLKKGKYALSLLSPENVEYLTKGSENESR